VLVSRGQILLGEGRTLEALDLAAQALAAEPRSEGIGQLMFGIAEMFTKADEPYRENAAQ
jgi:hypothetical protein